MADPVLLINGASRGIGAATARAAATAGYRLALAARSSGAIEELADALGGSERALALACDVREWDEQRSAVQRTLGRFGQIDACPLDTIDRSDISLRGNGTWSLQLRPPRRPQHPPGLGL